MKAVREIGSAGLGTGQGALLRAVVPVVLGMLLLCGCASLRQSPQEGMRLRQQLLEAAGCSFLAEVTADYGDQTHSFSMLCTADETGALTFRVTQPQTLDAVAGTISGTGGALVFEDTVLAFPLMADGTFSPVAAPWVVLKALRSGVLSSEGRDGDNTRITLEDKISLEPLTVDIWLNREGMPVQGDILHNERRILSVVIKEFQIQ